MKYEVDKAESQQALQQLRREFSSVSRWSYLAVCLSVIACFLFVYQAHLLATVASIFVLKQVTHEGLNTLLILLLSCIVLRAALRFVASQCNGIAGLKICAVYRQRLAAHLFSRHYLVAKEMVAADVVEKGIKGVDVLFDFYAQYMPNMFLSVLLPIVLLCFAFYQSWVVGSIMLATAFLIPLFMALIGMGVSSLCEKQFVMMGRLSAFFVNLLSGLKTLKLLGCAEEMTDLLVSQSHALSNATLAVLRIAFISSAVLALFSALSIALIAVYLGLSLLHYIHMGFYHSTVDLQMALFLLLLAPEFYAPLRQLAKDYHSKSEAVAGMRVLIKLLSTADDSATEDLINCPPESASGDVENLLKQAPALTLDCLDFVYSEHGYTVLNQISCSINKGECVAVLGASGSGKSTLLRVIAGLLLPSSGQMLLDGKPLQDYRQETWWRTINYMKQSPDFLSDSIADNLRIANPDATDTLLWAALESAGAADFVAQLPNKLETEVGDSAYGLSGGERQRLALARMFLKPGTCLLLDEPTRSLDAKTESLVLSALAGKRKGATVLISTHREHIAAFADRVIFLDNNMLVFDGLFDVFLKEHPDFFNKEVE